MNALLDRRGWIGLPLAMTALVVSWWLYVPLHELLHAWGCLLAGGTVDRLEIAAVYGGEWVARWVPFVVPASDYAGRLSGFDTHGSDAIYLATVLAPYALTLMPGLPLLHASIRSGHPVTFGLALPLAYAPLMSLTGDYYEVGSIIASRLASPWRPEALARWRSDDLPKLLETLGQATEPMQAADGLGITTGFLLGLLAAWATYGAGCALARHLARHRAGSR